MFSLTFKANANFQKKYDRTYPKQDENIPFDVATLGKDKRPDASRQNNVNGRKVDENYSARS